MTGPIGAQTRRFRVTVLTETHYVGCSNLPVLSVSLFLMKKDEDVEVLSINGHDVRVTHPGKLYFSGQIKLTKLDLVRYYLSVAHGALNGIRDRPIVLKRFVDGAEGQAFYQKRAPTNTPEWLRTVTLSFPSGDRKSVV